MVCQIAHICIAKDERALIAGLWLLVIPAQTWPQYETAIDWSGLFTSTTLCSLAQSLINRIQASVISFRVPTSI